jgi:hypothetical protein
MLRGAAVLCALCCASSWGKLEPLGHSSWGQFLAGGNITIAICRTFSTEKESQAAGEEWDADTVAFMQVENGRFGKIWTAIANAVFPAMTHVLRSANRHGELDAPFESEVPDLLLCQDDLSPKWLSVAEMLHGSPQHAAKAEWQVAQLSKLPPSDKEAQRKERWVTKNLVMPVHTFADAAAHGGSEEGGGAGGGRAQPASARVWQHGVSPVSLFLSTEPFHRFMSGD